MVSASDVEDRKIQKICRRPGTENRGVFPGNSEKEDRRVKKRAKMHKKQPEKSLKLVNWNLCQVL